LLRVNEAAMALHVSRWTVLQWLEDGALRATEIGKQGLSMIDNSVDKLISDNLTAH
jgi:excisionase family DNA binding protein